MNDTIDYGRGIIRAEADALLALEQELGDSFDHAVKLILGLTSHGHVITSGIGKAGFIAQKISATFASIGVPSFFLHPAEAIHGDIGRFTKHDLALVLSNSGETPEILAMLPGIRRIGCPALAITAQTYCSLGSHCDVVIAIGKAPEAGPLGLAPTTSTTMMLAVGDALAMTVLRDKGLSREEYARYHPGGSLGRSLLTVKDIMRTGDELCTVPETMLCKDVLHHITLTKGRPGAAAVIDAHGILSGIFTDGDLRRCLEKEVTFLEQPVAQFMGRAPKTVTSNRLASEAANMMSEFKIDQILVVGDHRELLGIVDVQDLLAVGLL